MPRILSFGRASLLASFLCAQSIALAQKTPEQIQKHVAEIKADTKVQNVRISPERQTPSLISFRQTATYSRDQVPAVLASYLEVKAGVDQLVPVRQHKPTPTIEVNEFEQKFRGIPVAHGRYKALLRNGQVAFVSGAWYDVPQTLSVSPALNEAAALQKALQRVGARKYAWQQVQEEIDRRPGEFGVRAELRQELEEYTPKGELVIIKDFNKKGVAEMRLAWKFNIYAAEPVSRAWIYVDARSGTILLVDKIIKHLDDAGGSPASTSVSTTVQTRYAGTQSIKTRQLSGSLLSPALDPILGLPLISSHPTTEVYVPGASTWVLQDDTRGNGIETFDLNGVGGIPLNVAALYSQGKSFTDVDNNWTLAEHHRSPANEGAFEAENDDIAWDAHWGAEVVYDYWLARHNRLSYDGNNARIRNFIHYGPAYDNAFWNGTAMTYGDGSGTAAQGFKALTSLDVCGHEIGHGVCSFTADLVYANESGAMNEGFSDIWAACVEHFSMSRSGSTVPPTAYRPFYIGEQIGANENAPLRRMDNPKAQGNPDTYGGVNWVDQNCSPSLANDQCGVHTNSGVINHWFYLLTAGSKNGFRPAEIVANQYIFGDSDDEINDLGNAYRVNGVGFQVSEQVAFLTELMLTANATYAEAREASVEVAIAMNGDPCGSLVESVANAWYACGVGGQFVKPCLVTYGFIAPAITINEAAIPAGCSSEKTIEIPVVLPAGSSATITASGSAVSGQDYVLATTTLSNSGTTTTKKNIVVTVKNDGMVEQDEIIQLSISLTNAGGNPVNNMHTITITDDDVIPVIGNGDRVLIGEGFTRADGFGGPAGWAELLEIPEGAADPQATGKNHWGIFGNKLAITGKEGLTGLQLPSGTYNSNSESRVIIRTPLIDARGLSKLTIAFDYRVQGEVDAASGSTDIENLPVFDYMTIVYSFDGVHFTELNREAFQPFAALLPEEGSFAAQLPAVLGNRQFYLGFRWNNDANAGGPESVTIDNLNVRGAQRRIENEPGHNGRENLGAGQEVYVYSQQDGELLGKVKNNSSSGFGCTNLVVEHGGTGAFNLYGDRNGLHKVSDKVVRIEASLIYKVSQTVSLYYSEAQLAGLEQATGQPRTAFSIYLVSAASYGQAANNNTKKYAASYAALPGAGGFYTFTFTERINGSYALGYPVSMAGTGAQPITRTETAEPAWSFDPIYPNPGKAVASLNVRAPKGHKVIIEVVSMSGQVLAAQSATLTQGRNSIMLPVQRLGAGSYYVRVRDESGNTLYRQQYQRY